MAQYKRNYTQYYTEGSVARQPMYAPEYERPVRRGDELPDYAKVRKAKKQTGLKVAMHPVFALFLAVSVAATLLACVLLLKTQTLITNQSDEITLLQAQIETLTDENNAYEARIMSNVDIEAIRDRAMNELGMVYPSEGQVVYYDLMEADYVRQYKDVPTR